MNPFLAVDGYKIFHQLMSPKGTSLIYSNFTPRSNKHAPKGCDKVLVFGTQMTIREIVSNFKDDFFGRDRETVLAEIKKEYDMYSMTDYNVSKIKALWDLGHLPVKIKGIPEGEFVPMGVPVLTIYNTIPGFEWVTNFLETMISNLLWKPMTSATLAYNFKKLNDKWIDKTDKGNDFHSQFGCHDFSMRGLDSLYATMSSGLGHAVSFLGSDSLPVIHGAREYYDAEDFVVGSIPATEHSIQCAYYNGSDYDYIKNILERFPAGPVGIVSDGFDLWKLITEELPKLKDQIMAREGGPVVIRPDSGNPVDIMCGKTIMTHDELEDYLYSDDYKYSVDHIVMIGEDGLYYPAFVSSWPDGSISDFGIDLEEKSITEEVCKGVIELLWDIFGGTTNEQGYKVLHPSIRAIYGDSINLERFNEINTRLEAKGFTSTNWVAGIGSFTYQFNTRDTFGFAMKSTYQEVTEDGRTKGVNIFKDPITDDGTKKSAKGLLCVTKNPAQERHLLDECTWEVEEAGALQTIFNNGEFENVITLKEIREKL